MQVDRKRSVANRTSILAIRCAALFCLLFLPGSLLAKDFTFSWSANPEPVEGYRLYYKMGGDPVPPFDGTMAAEGESPVSVGKVTTATVSGLAENTTYHFALTAYNGEIESDYSAILTVVGEQTPLQAVITASGEEGEAPYSVNFDGSSSTGAISSYSWDFDDGATASGPTVSHIFASAGSYTTKLTVVDHLGGTHQASRLITVNSPPPPPPPPPPTEPLAVIITSATSGTAPITIHFDGSDSSTAQPPMVSYLWDFGDGSSGSGATVNHSFIAGGTYQVGLTVTDSAGLSGQTSSQIVVEAVPEEEPVAPEEPDDPETPAEPAPGASYSFTWSANPDPIEGYRLYYKKGGDAVPPFDGTGASEGPSAIDVGNQTSFTITGLEENTPYHFATTAYNGNVESDYSDIITVFAEQAPLMAVVTASAESGEAPLTVNFAGTSSTGEVNSYSWVFGDGAIASGPTVSHRFDQAGEFTTTLTVASQTGETKQASVTISVTAPTVQPPEDFAPTAVISSSTAAGAAPLTVVFDGSDSVSDAAPITNYLWTFGDGNSHATSSEAPVSHTYITPGTYQATLTVVNSADQTDQTNTPVMVMQGIQQENQAPVASFTASPSSGAPPLTVSFDAGGSSDPDGSISSYQWSFGDGGAAVGVTAEHIFSQIGEYTVTLTVTDNFGLSASKSQLLSVNTDEEKDGKPDMQGTIHALLYLLLNDD